jgi:hypothetical protein
MNEEHGKAFVLGFESGEASERERIIRRIKAQICFDALADEDSRCSNHGGKCYELGLLIKSLSATGK